jgi:segregation and condensation protein A
MIPQTQTVPQNGDYRVDLDIFSGPLDLLLHLIRKEEVDIYDIPIARITNQYIRYIDMMENLNLEVAGEFILMAATLIRIKARLLLPRTDEESDEPDPREELIMALVEYRKYKEGGDILRDRALEEERVYVPTSPVKQVEGRIDFEPVTNLYDLIVAFRTVMSQRHEEITHDVNQEEISIEERMFVVLELLRERDGATFVELFADVPRKIIAIVTFIALLELARTRRIRIQQVKPFTEMRVYRGDKYEAPPEDVDVVEMTTTRELSEA